MSFPIATPTTAPLKASSNNIKFSIPHPLLAMSPHTATPTLSRVETSTVPFPSSVFSSFSTATTDHLEDWAVNELSTSEKKVTSDNTIERHQTGPRWVPGSTNDALISAAAAAGLSSTPETPRAYPSHSRRSPRFFFADDKDDEDEDDIQPTFVEQDTIYHHNASSNFNPDIIRSTNPLLIEAQLEHTALCSRFSSFSSAGGSDLDELESLCEDADDEPHHNHVRDLEQRAATVDLGMTEPQPKQNSAAWRQAQPVKAYASPQQHHEASHHKSSSTNDAAFVPCGLARAQSSASSEASDQHFAFDDEADDSEEDSIERVKRWLVKP